MASRKKIVAGIAFSIATIAGLIAAQHYAIASPAPSTTGIGGWSKTALEPFQRVTGLEIAPGEKPLGYAKRLSDTVHLTTYHCDPTNYALSWLDQVMWWSTNYTDAFADGVLVRERFNCGFCHQRAFLVAEQLEKEGISAEVYGLYGHVVARFWVGGNPYFVDPDLGVGPFSNEVAGLEADLVNIYKAGAPWPVLGPKEVARMYLTTADNDIYGGLPARRSQQQIIFERSDAAAATLSVGGGLLGFIGLMWGVRTRKVRRAPSLMRSS